MCKGSCLFLSLWLRFSFSPFLPPMQPPDLRLAEIELRAKFGSKLARMTRNSLIQIHQYNGANAQGTPLPYLKHESKKAFLGLITRIMDGIVRHGLNDSPLPSGDSYSGGIDGLPIPLDTFQNKRPPLRTARRQKSKEEVNVRNLWGPHQRSMVYKDTQAH